MKSVSYSQRVGVPFYPARLKNPPTIILDRSTLSPHFKRGVFQAPDKQLSASSLSLQNVIDTNNEAFLHPVVGTQFGNIFDQINQVELKLDNIHEMYNNLIGLENGNNSTENFSTDGDKKDQTEI